MPAIYARDSAWTAPPFQRRSRTGSTRNTNKNAIAGVIRFPKSVQQYEPTSTRRRSSRKHHALRPCRRAPSTLTPNPALQATFAPSPTVALPALHLLITSSPQHSENSADGLYQTHLPLTVTFFDAILVFCISLTQCDGFGEEMRKARKHAPATMRVLLAKLECGKTRETNCGGLTSRNKGPGSRTFRTRHRLRVAKWSSDDIRRGCSTRKDIHSDAGVCLGNMQRR